MARTAAGPSCWRRKIRTSIYRNQNPASSLLDEPPRILSALACLDRGIDCLTTVAIAKQRVLDGVDAYLVALVLADNVNHFTPIDAVGLRAAARLYGQLASYLTLPCEPSRYHEPEAGIEPALSGWKPEVRPKHFTGMTDLRKGGITQPRPVPRLPWHPAYSPTFLRSETSLPAALPAFVHRKTRRGTTPWYSVPGSNRHSPA